MTHDLPSLEAFSVTIDYGRSHTTFNVVPEGGRQPAARMRKDSAYDTRHPYEVHSGPGLDQFLGWVTPFAAMTAERAEIGTVEYHERSVRGDDWVITQHGLPAPLTGRPEGLSSELRHGSPLRMIPLQEMSDAFLSSRLLFSSPHSPGFTLTRRGGVRGRFAVEIHDPAVDRLLVLACVAQFALYADNVKDPRKAFVNYTTLSSKETWTRRRKG
jgi:hypothetical protein